MMNLRSMLLCAGLAMPCAALGQTQTYLMIPSVEGDGAIMLFDPQNGSLINPTFIPGLGGVYSFATPKEALQVGEEIWVADQVEDSIFRFDFNGRYIATVTGNMDNIRGLEHLDGFVYVSNASASGSSPANSVVKFDVNGNYVMSWAVGNSPFDVLAFNSELLVTHFITTAVPDVTRWRPDGTSTGTFHMGAIQGSQQISRKGNGNFLVAGFSGTAGTVQGLYEYDATGNQVAYIPASGPRGVMELGNGNLIWTAGDVFVYDTVAATSTVVAPDASHYINRLQVNAALTGPCCLGNGTCATLSLADCGTQGGVFRGSTNTCATVTCPAAAACCYSDGTCAVLQQGACLVGGGVFNSGASSCASVTCPTYLATTLPGSTTSTANSGIFFDLTAAQNLSVYRIDYYAGSTTGSAVTVDIYTKQGTYVGNDNIPGVWTHAGTYNGTSGAGTTPVQITLNTPIEIESGQVQGMYLVGTVGGLRYRASTTPNPVSNGQLTLESNIFRSALFAGTATTGRRFGGTVWYNLQTGPQCYANCDGSTVAPILNVGDFTCFLQRFAAGESYANCDSSTIPPVLNVGDFTCFLQSFAAGCP
jgi:hypothetical protein